MKRFDDAEVGLRTESPVGVDRLGIVGIKLAEDVESVFRQHLFGTSSVVVSEREPGVVRRIGTIAVVRLLVRIREICIVERVHIRVRHLGFLPCGFHSHVDACPVRRGQCHLRIDIVSAVVVVDEHSVLVVEAEGDVVCAFS